jgi:hypothetical protein
MTCAIADDSLIDRRLVLLGGPLGADAAYVLRCTDLAEAEAIVAGDPLVSSGAAVPTITEWALVGVDPRVIDPDLPTFS